MAISLVSSNGAAESTFTLPSHSSGNFILLAQYRDSTTTGSTIPDNFTEIVNSTQTQNNGLRLCYKWAASSSETLTGYTNTHGFIAHVYSGVDPDTPVGGSSTASNSSTTITYNGLTFTVGDGTSMAVAVVGSRAVDTTNIAEPPAGLSYVLDF